MIAGVLGMPLIATQAGAVSLDLSNGTFDNGVITYTDVIPASGTRPAADLIVEAINGTTLDNADVFNPSVGSNTGQINIRNQTSVDLGFFLVEAGTSTPFPRVDVEFGIADIDFNGREVVTALTQGTATVRVGNNLNLSSTPNLTVSSVSPGTNNVPNPSDLGDLDDDQERVSVLYEFDNVNSFAFRFASTGGASNSGRFFLYSSDVSFDGETETVPNIIPLPASAVLLLAALGGLGLVRTRRT